MSSFPAGSLVLTESEGSPTDVGLHWLEFSDGSAGMAMVFRESHEPGLVRLCYVMSVSNKPYVLSEARVVRHCRVGFDRRVARLVEEEGSCRQKEVEHLHLWSLPW